MESRGGARAIFARVAAKRSRLPRLKDRQTCAYTGLAVVGFCAGAHHLFVMRHLVGTDPPAQRSANARHAPNERLSNVGDGKGDSSGGDNDKQVATRLSQRATNKWPSLLGDANESSVVARARALDGQFMWTRKYAALEPLGFGGYMEAPPSPPRLSLLESYLLLPSQEARTRRARQRRASYPSADPTSSPSVCVVLTNYNNAMFINATIVDTLTQTFQGDYWVVAVDDYSTDGSRAHIRAWAREHERLVPVLLPGRSMGGTGIPSNIGLDICQQHEPAFTYIAFVDGDDVLEPDFLEQLVAIGENTGAQVIISDFDLWDRGKTSSVKARSEMEGWGQLPKGEVIDPNAHFSHLAMLMPAPWRKMLRLDYIEKYDLRFPEGDFFYEDNVLHWLIILTASRIVLYPHVLVHHRTSRSLFGTHEVRNAGFFSVMNAIGDAVVGRELYGEHAQAVVTEFIAFTSRLRWIVKRQGSEKMRNKFASCFTRFDGYWLPKLQRIANVSLPSRTDMETANYISGGNVDLPLTLYTPLELSIVVPVYNAAPFLDSLVERIDQISDGCHYEAFFVNGASTDGSGGILRRLSATRPRMYDVQLEYTAPAGFLRNLVMPLLEGLYVFFLDSDDSVDAAALEAATAVAMREGIDVLMLPYQLVFVAQDGGKEVASLVGMDKNDQATWEQMVALEFSSDAREAALTLVNYPWNRLTRTQLLHDENGIFFGTTQVQNDVQYHWHGLSVAKRVAFLSAASAPVCFHKKFVGTQRMQLTKIKSSRRLEMFWALQATHRVLCAASDPFNDDSSTMAAWGNFVNKTLVWARNTKLIPTKSMPTFLHNKAHMLNCVTSCSTSCLYSQWMPSRNRIANSSHDHGLQIRSGSPSPPAVQLQVNNTVTV